MTNLNLVTKQQTQFQWIKGHLTSAQNRKWYGKITIEIKKGLIDLVRLEETLKPPQDEKNSKQN